MSRCELHDTLGNQCPTLAVIQVAAVIDATDGNAILWGAAACDGHAWEATAHAARRVQQARIDRLPGPRIVAAVDDAGEQLLELLQQGITLGERWPLAEPWVR